MNYLSHYYFDRKNADPYYILGIALPDLVKNHNRRWNVHPSKFEKEYAENPHLQSIYQGWLQHLRVDHYFHESSFFTEKSHLITTRMRTIPFENTKVKPFMIGHVGLEIMLDTLLIKNKNLDASIFYSHLGSCDMSHIIRFLEINEIENAAAFQHFYERFCEFQYLLSYQNNESIVYALNRIQFRLTQQYLSDKDVTLMNKEMAAIMELVEQDYLFIFEEIEAHILNEKTKHTLPNN
jgi:hypothetical protein